MTQMQAPGNQKVESSVLLNVSKEHLLEQAAEMSIHRAEMFETSECKKMDFSKKGKYYEVLQSKC